MICSGVTNLWFPPEFHFGYHVNLSQGDRGEYLLKVAATKVMYDTVTRCLHYTLLMFVFCFK